MTLQYDLKLSIEDADKWGDSRKTHKAVAMAIHAIADKKRPPQKIWEEPTQAEYDHVCMAVENYIENGVFLPEENGRYPWGEGVIIIHATSDA